MKSPFSILLAIVMVAMASISYAASADNNWTLEDTIRTKQEIKHLREIAKAADKHSVPDLLKERKDSLKEAIKSESITEQADRLTQLHAWEKSHTTALSKHRLQTQTFEWKHSTNGITLIQYFAGNPRSTGIHGKAFKMQPMERKQFIRNELDKHLGDLQIVHSKKHDKKVKLQDKMQALRTIDRDTSKNLPTLVGMRHAIQSLLISTCIDGNTDIWNEVENLCQYPNSGLPTQFSEDNAITSQYAIFTWELKAQLAVLLVQFTGHNAPEACKQFVSALKPEEIVRTTFDIDGSLLEIDCFVAPSGAESSERRLELRKLINGPPDFAPAALRAMYKRHAVHYKTQVELYGLE